jgi:4-methyl-5(b-hydroxyethyl)-thiazole monophosphate biosynthesis
MQFISFSSTIFLRQSHDSFPMSISDVQKISCEGAQHLANSKALTEILQKQKNAQKLYAAVCASPAIALAPQGLIDDGVPVTSYPAPHFREKIQTVSDDKVVVSNNLITSQGPGTSLLFALQLGEQLFGKEKRDEIAKQMLVD